MKYLLSLWLITTLTFFMVLKLPGDPFDDEQGLPKEMKQALRDHYGLDAPLYQQYIGYLRCVITLDFGNSLVQKETPVTSLIANSLPVSLFLGAQSLILSLIAGYILGIWIAFAKKETVLIIVCIAIPSFVIATLLQYFLGMKWHILPVAKLTSYKHSLLPTLALSLSPTAFIAKQLSGNLKEVYSQDYIVAAYAKGLNRAPIFFNYALKNASLPLLAYFGQLTTQILTGSFIIEKIFALPGIGYWMVTSVLNRDYPSILALTLLFSIILLTTTTISNKLYLKLNPRARRSAICV